MNIIGQLCNNSLLDSIFFKIIYCIYTHESCNFFEIRKKIIDRFRIWNGKFNSTSFS